MEALNSDQSSTPSTRVRAPERAKAGSSETIESGKARTVTSTKLVREGGGVYIYRTRKPSSLLGLLLRELQIPWWAWPIATVLCVVLCHFVTGMWWLGLLILACTGRHFAYVGETVSFKDRHAEHIQGGGRWKKRSAAWSDLDPVCVARIPLGKWKPLLRFVETVLIFFLQPVYNEKKNLWNLRRIPRPSALRMRLRRDKRRVRLNIFNLRAAHMIVLVVIGIVIF